MELLKDPLGDRPIKTVPLPIHSAKPISDRALFPHHTGKLKLMNIYNCFLKIEGSSAPAIPDWRLVKDQLMREGKLTKSQVNRILRDSIGVLGNFQ